MSKSGNQLEQTGGSKDLKGPAIRSFLGIAKAWSLSEGEQVKLLALADEAILKRWTAGELSELSLDTMRRISYLLGIFRAINTLLPDHERADAWMRAPNHGPLFDGRSALDRMKSGDIDDLQFVRRYLEAELT